VRSVPGEFLGSLAALAGLGGRRIAATAALPRAVVATASAVCWGVVIVVVVATAAVVLFTATALALARW